MKITNNTTLNNLNMDALNISFQKPGVYLITNLINGKKYIGSSSVLIRRFKEYSKFSLAKARSKS